MASCCIVRFGASSVFTTRLFSLDLFLTGGGRRGEVVPIHVLRGSEQVYCERSLQLRGGGDQEADCTHSRFGDFSFFFKSSGRFCQMHVVIAFRGLFVCFLCKRNTTYIHIAIYVGICVCVWTAISCPGRWGAKRSQVFFALCHAGRPPLFVEFIFDSEND